MAAVTPLFLGLLDASLQAVNIFSVWLDDSTKLSSSKYIFLFLEDTYEEIFVMCRFLKKWLLYFKQVFGIELIVSY